MSVKDWFTGGHNQYMPTTQAQLNAAAVHRQATPPVPAEKVELVESEIIAWRGWNVGATDDLEPILLSFNATRWDGPTLTADKPPAAESPHGIYALKERPAYSVSEGRYFAQGAFGQVALSGLVVEGDNGYRAERAIVRSIWLANPGHFGPLGDRFCAWELAGMLEQRYGVDVGVATENWPQCLAELHFAEEMRRMQYMRYR